MSPNGDWDNLTPWPKRVPSYEVHERRLRQYDLMTRMFIVVQTLAGRVSLPSEDNFAAMIRNRIIEQASAPVDWTSRDTQEKALRLTSELGLEMLSPEERRDMLAELKKWLGDDLSGDVSFKAAMELHELRKATMYVESNGMSPREQWCILTRRHPELHTAFASESQFHLAVYHLDYLRSHSSTAFESLALLTEGILLDIASAWRVG